MLLKLNAFALTKHSFDIECKVAIHKMALFGFRLQFESIFRISELFQFKFQ